MKPKSWALLSAFGCGIPTLVGGTVILSFGAWFLGRVAPQYQEGIKTIAGIKNDPDIMIPIAIGISAILAVFLGCGVGFLVYRWRQKKDLNSTPSPTPPAGQGHPTPAASPCPPVGDR